MPFWALPGYNLTPENSLALVLLQLFPFFGGFGALGWVFNREILFPCFPADRVTVISPEHGNVKYSRISTGWHHRSSGSRLGDAFFPQICILRWCRWFLCGGKGTCSGISGYKQELIWELPLGILITESGCCIHIYMLYIYVRNILNFGIEHCLFIWVWNRKWEKIYNIKRTKMNPQNSCARWGFLFSGNKGIINNIQEIKE